MLGLNIQSLRSHHDELVVEVESYSQKPKFIALTETWITKSDTDHLKTTGEKLQHHKDFCIASYHSIESKPQKEYKEGGVAFYVHETLKYLPIEYDTDIDVCN